MTKKVKAFFHVFSNSLLPQAPYYRKIIKVPLSFSLKYFLFLVFTVNLFFVFFYLLGSNPKEIYYIKNSFSKSLAEFPKELKIYINNGMLQTNIDRPYFMWLDLHDKKNLLLVVDQSAMPEKIKQYKANILLTSRYFVLNKNKFNDKAFIIPYEKSSFSFGKETIDQLLLWLNKYFYWFVFLAMVFSIFLFPLLLFGVSLIYLFSLSLICFVIFKFFYKKNTIMKTFQISLHATTLPFIVQYAINSFLYNARFFQMKLLLALLLLIFILSGLYEAYLDKPQR